MGCTDAVANILKDFMIIRHHHNEEDNTTTPNTYLLNSY